MTKQETYEAIREFFSRPGAVLAKAAGRFEWHESRNEYVFVPEEMDPDTLGYDEANENVCFYRHPDNPDVRCAFGCLIPDEFYAPAMENRGAWMVVDTYPSVAELFPWASREEGFSLLDDFQSAHDSTATTTVEEFLERLDRVAEDNGLTVVDS
jgi:hypothetical protein